jgi:uncharacterized membrane protein (UPF0127 family)
MIKNQSKNKILAKKTRFCNNLFTMGLGLMFFFKIKDIGYVFPFKRSVRGSIHMWFVFDSIDVLFLDKNNAVIEIKKDLKPFAFYKPNKHYYTFIELPVGTISKTNTKIGDKIVF